MDDAAADRLIARLPQGPSQGEQPDLYLILSTDVSNFRTGTDTEAERKADAGKAPVYKYYFQWYSPVRDGKLRSYHTLEIPFVFENVDIAESMNGTRPGALPAGGKNERRLGRLCAHRQSEPQGVAELGAFHAPRNAPP